MPNRPAPLANAIHRWALSALLGLLSVVGAHAEVRPLEIVLPTPNRAIFGPDPSQFYMYTHRSFEGRQSTPWQAGKYGYVRNPKRTSSGLIYSRFHEGVDIKPTSRDRSGKPLDTVRSIAAGAVAHTSTSSGASSYGRYVVIKHNWGYGDFYSLYAHLESITCRVGQVVRPGTPIGKLGYTGPGLDRVRAHLHMELNLMLSTRFERWHDTYYRSANPHGKFNGLNLAGIDIAGLYLKHRRDPSITLPQLLSRMQLYYKVLVPNKGTPDLLRFYPWLARDMAKARGNPSWEISLSSSGVPLAVSPSTTKVGAPKVSWVKHSSYPHSWNTRSRLSGSGSSASLTGSGSKYVKLLSGDF